MALIALIKAIERKDLVKEKESLMSIITTKDFLSKLSTMYKTKTYLSKYIGCLLVNTCKSPVYNKILMAELGPEVIY